MDGVAEKNAETWDNCEQNVKEFFTDKLELENDIVIERAHRDKKKKSTASHTAIPKRALERGKTVTWRR